MALKQADEAFFDEDYARAQELYEVAAKLEPEREEALLRLAQTHIKLRNWVAAVATANDAIRVAPANPSAYMRKGVAAFNLDEFETALAAFLKAQQLRPDDANPSLKTWIRKCQAELDADSSASTTAPAPAAPAPAPAPMAEALGECSASESAPAPVQAAAAAVAAAPVPVQAVAAAAAAPAPAPAPTAPKVRHEWYQTPTHVIVEVFARGVKDQDLRVVFGERTLAVTLQLGEGREYALDFDLCGAVVPAESAWTIFAVKVEIRMKKQQPGPWAGLQASAIKSFKPGHPGTKKDWDKIARVEVADEKPEGDAALQSVFQQIFANGTPEQQRAMVKSFTESGGTVLSTNWAEVSKGDVKGSPPPGQVMHKWGDS
eukprot:TRINITY_DN17199_c0_g1_i1.p2 TRINITY_DN17199_c0_g1~~TRINITY_DN17199_c0_g1_i1.p2  ORF type:complete len:402 (+),score=132.41 TRINITY_DN17199_c0_g1_i1:87-1208(+)